MADHNFGDRERLIDNFGWAVVFAGLAIYDFCCDHRLLVGTVSIFLIAGVTVRLLCYQ